ncbi:hypothetical protein SNEBB_003386 [Seison nebaliae]|nr:hypothetical protein SNEBB_003386 [Seison nebaliae]
MTPYWNKTTLAIYSQIFSTFEVDHRGVINIGDIGDVLRAMNCDLSVNDELNIVQKFIDIDKEFVNFSEFLKIVDEHLTAPIPYDELCSALVVLNDIGPNGVFSVEELKDNLMDIETNLTVREFYETMEYCGYGDDKSLINPLVLSRELTERPLIINKCDYYTELNRLESKKNAEARDGTTLYSISSMTLSSTDESSSED